MSHHDIYKNLINCITLNLINCITFCFYLLDAMIVYSKSIVK